MSGKLFLVGTPIGNLSDITLRAIDVLKEVDVIACEDTRHTLNLLRHLNIHKPMLRYDEHVHERSAQQILSHLDAGKSVALVTDAGTPAISDPGQRLVALVARSGKTVVPVPGPSAVGVAVSAAGFVSEGFVFLAFLPRRKGRAERELREALGLGKTLVIFESPFRIIDTLQLLADLRPRAEIVVARELTKLHEEFIRGSVDQVIDQIKSHPRKGEMVLIIGPQEM